MLRKQRPTVGGNDHSRVGPGGGRECVRDPAGGDNDKAEVCYRGIRLYVYVSRMLNDDDLLLLQDHVFV